MKDLEWSKELRFQLPISFCLDVFTIQPYLVTEGIASRLNAFIVGSLLKFLSVVEVFSANNYQLS